MVSGYFQTCSCPYCIKNGGWPNLKFVKTIDRFWFETPKNASVSIKWECGINKSSRTKAKMTEGDKAILVYRDPIVRFKSTLIHYFHESGLRFKNHEGKRFPDGIGFFKDLGYNIEEIDIDKRVDIILDNLNVLSTKYEVHHWWPQVNFFDTNNVDIIPMEKVNEVFNISRKRNVAPKKVDLKFTKEQRQKIIKIYEEDYNYFEGKI